MKKPAEKSRRRPLIIVACLILGVPLLLCAGVTAWFFGRQSAAADEVHRRIEDLSQRGEPVDNQSLQLFYEVSTSAKNTEQWVAIRKTMEGSEFAKSAENTALDSLKADDVLALIPRPGEAWEDRKTIDDFLHTWRAELKTIHTLAKAEFVNLGKPLRRPIQFASVATLLPDTQCVRELARLLRVEHGVALHDGDQQRGFECIRDCIGLARSIDGEPLMISQLVGQATEGIAGTMLQTSIEHDQLSDQQMSELADKLPTFARLCDLFALGIRGERASMLPLFSDPQQAVDILGMERMPGATLMTKMRASDTLYYLRVMDGFLSLPTNDMQTFREAAGKAADQINNDARHASLLQTMDRAMTLLMLPAIGAYAEAFVRRAEFNNLIKLAMAVRRFHHQFHRWPQSLGQLSEIGVDASQLEAANWPFGFRVEEDGSAVLWGIYPTTAPTLPSEPPETEGENQPNQAWVWRLRP